MNRLKYSILAGVMFTLVFAGAGIADDDEHDKCREARFFT